MKPSFGALIDILRACVPSCDLSNVQIRAITGGFSGGRVYQVTIGNSMYALRAWPRNYPAGRAPIIHHLMAKARVGGCTFVPAVHGTTFDHATSTTWDLSEWMVGDALRSPNNEQLRSAARALAQWHQSFDASEIQTLGDPQSGRPHAGEVIEDTSPGLWRRVQEWERLVPLLANSQSSPSSEPVGRTRRLIERFQPLKPILVHAAALRRPMAVCLRDVHREHVLFRQDRVCGIIDYSSMGVDWPAADLGRYLFSVAADQPARWEAFLTEYADKQDPSLLQATVLFGAVGAWIGVLHWWEWLVLHRRKFENADRANARWQALLGDLETWLNEGGMDSVMAIETK